MIKRAFVAIMVAVSCALYFWLAGAFIGQELNPMNWSYAGRGMFATVFLPASMIIGAFAWCDLTNEP